MVWLSVLTACTGLPEGVEVVDDLELDRYLGTWYEIARLDHRFERGLSDVTANYSLRDDGGVRVVNRGFNVEEGAWQDAEGKAYFHGEPTVGRLKVSFFGPFYGGYNIIDLDRDNYQWSLVVGPDRAYLWILSRSPELEPAILQRLTAKAEMLGFATSELIFVTHDRHVADQAQQRSSGGARP
jgi:apolipoprotein D and lipocalin family protein